MVGFLLRLCDKEQKSSTSATRQYPDPFSLLGGGRPVQQDPHLIFFFGGM